MSLTHQPTLAQFIEQRLANDVNVFNLLKTMRVRSFSANTFRECWWIRALKSQTLPMPFVAVWFSILGLLVVIADALKLSLARQSFAVRASVNIGYIVLPFLFTLFLSGGIFG